MTVTQATGKFKLVHEDANEHPLGDLIEKHSSAFGTANTPLTNPELMPKMAKSATVINEDEKLYLYFKPDVAYTPDVAADVLTIQIPVTVRNIRSGGVYNDVLTALDFNSADKYMPAATAMSAGVWYKIDYYTVTAQTSIKLGVIEPDTRVASALNLHIANAA